VQRILNYLFTFVNTLFPIKKLEFSLKLKDTFAKFYKAGNSNVPRFILSSYRPDSVMFDAPPDEPVRVKVIPLTFPDAGVIAVNPVPEPLTE